MFISDRVLLAVSLREVTLIQQIYLFNMAGDLGNNETGLVDLHDSAAAHL